GAQLRLPEAVGYDLRACRQGGEREDIADDAPLDVQFDRRRDAAQRKGRVRRQALLEQGRFRQAELVVARLQAAIVEERDLNRRVRRQPACEQAFDRGTRQRRIFTCAYGDDVFFQFVAG